MPSYYILALIGAHILRNYNAKSIEFYSQKLNPLKLIKQVVSMILCINEPKFSIKFPELLEFVKKPENQSLPDRYKIYMYINNEGNTRHNPMMYHSDHGIITEVAFAPLGFLLSIDKAEPLPFLFDITHFKNYSEEYIGNVNFNVKILQTHVGYISGDYRTKEEIDETVRKSKEFVKQHNMK